MKTILSATLFLLFSTLCLSAEDAHKSKPLKLLYFTAKWCGPCQLMKQETWPKPIVQKSLEAYDFQTIDVDKQEELAEQWSVRSMPTYLIVDPEGEIELVRMSGFMDAYRMSTWLDEINAQAKKTLQSILTARRVADENWALIAPLSRDSITEETLQEGREALYTLLKHRNDLEENKSKELNIRLHTIAETHPEYIAEGILHQDLQVRAYITRALAANDIKFDPWAKQNERELAYAKFLKTINK